jgi:glucose-1-phosphate cytidylyltransferase
MKAETLSGWPGTRLAGETALRPRPTVTIGRRLSPRHITNIHAARGINDFVIRLGYRGSRIKEYVADLRLDDADITVGLASGRQGFRRSRLAPRRVTLIDTGEDAFCMTYGDRVADTDITAEMIAFLRAHGRFRQPIGTLRERQTPERLWRSGAAPWKVWP